MSTGSPAPSGAGVVKVITLGTESMCIAKLDKAITQEIMTLRLTSNRHHLRVARPPWGGALLQGTQRHRLICVPELLTRRQ